MSFFFAPLEPGSFDVVHIDFPWLWETYSDKGRKKSPQYDCMTWEEIETCEADKLLAPGGVMFAWGTWPLIGRQHLILENCFGLDVKTGGAWSKRTKDGKLRWGPGYIIRTVCEPFLIATKKGHKLRGSSVKNLIETFDAKEVWGVARENSRKPEEVFDLINKLTPGLRRVDVFARESRPGWTTWGREKTKFDKKK